MFRPRPRARGSGGAADAPGRPDLGQLKRLLRFTKPYRTPLILALAATLVAGLLQLAFPLLARELFNDAFATSTAGAAAGASDAASAEGRGASPSLDVVALALVGLFVLQAGFNFVRVYFLGVVGEGVVADLRKAVFAHLLTLSPAFFVRRRTGEITSRLTSDVSTVQSLVSNALAQFVNQAVTLLGGAVVLFVINWRLTLLMLAVVPGVIVGGAAFGRSLRRVSAAFQDRVADANAVAEEAIANVRVVQSFTREPLERARYGAGIDDSWRLARRRALLRALFVPSVILAMFTGVTLVLWYGGRQVLAGALAPGDLIAFLLLTLFIAGSIATFTGLYSQLQEGLGASRRIFDLLDESPDLPVPERPLPIDAADGRGVEVRFDEVGFRYGDENAPWVLRDVDLTLRPGETVALVGPSGAGKSTMANLLPRFFDPQRGAVRLAGVDLRDAAPADVRRAIGIVPQETQLFSGTVAENIRYGRDDAGEAEVIAAAQAANADLFVRGLEHGYDTVVGERGLRLSGGQRQRIAIARALLKDPAVLVLDEATSSLDSESEALVQAALDHLMRGRTSLVIAHRLSTVVGADRVVVLQAGRIVQIGRHDELVTAAGPYRTLFETQFRAHAADG